VFKSTTTAMKMISPPKNTTCSDTGEGSIYPKLRDVKHVLVDKNFIKERSKYDSLDDVSQTILTLVVTKLVLNNDELMAYLSENAGFY
jgi:hypothetical protein